MPEWSKQQRLAIDTVDRSLLVSAAAGSGKTATLTQRCVELTCRADGCDITQLLVVTYTEAAAAEMKGRIASELRKLEAKITAEGGDASRVRRQLALLPSAQISTLHAFCAKLIRRNFQLVSLDPDFPVLDENEALLLKQEVVADLFEQQFQQKMADRFTRLIDLYADGSDNRIEAAVIRTHDVLRSLLDAGAWRRDAIEMLREVDSRPQFLQSRLGKRFAQMALTRIDELRRHAGHVIDSLKRIGGTASHIAVANEVIGRLDDVQQCVQSGQWSDVRTILDGRFTFSMQAKGCADPELAKGLVEKLKKPIQKSGDIYGRFLCDLSAWRSDIIRTLPLAEQFLDLVEAFETRFEQAKRAVHGVDFADLEHLALRLLREPAVAQTCRDRFQQVMVDEFQDVNEVQWEILRLLSRSDKPHQPANLFCVGDVKQSIYRFRMADPSIFLQREKDAGPRNELIAMQHNFRSRAELLDAVNFVFGELMQDPAAAEIVYTRLHRLEAHRNFPAAPQTLSGAPVEMHLILEGGTDAEGDGEADPMPPREDIDLDRLERESRYVAGWIQDLMKQNRQVLGKDGVYRPLSYGDIVILLRSARFSAIEYSRALSERNIPCFAESRTGFFTTVETNDLISILQLLDNRQQDIPLAAVLRCPVFGIANPETSLAAIRVAFPGLPFHQAVAEYATRKPDALAQSLQAVLARLDRWRHRALMLGVADLLWEILDDTSYLGFCKALPNGAQRVANVLYLHRVARNFAKFQQQGLYRFIRLLEELQEASDLGQPSPGETGNAVQVMTIHGSKGLEFPVVIVSEIGKKFNLQDAAGNILVDRRDHLALCVADEQRFIRYPSAASLIVRESITTAAKAEELRVLYVAMTRAQEQLLLVGSTTQKQLDYLRRQSSPGVDAQVFRSAASYLQWLAPLAAIDVGSEHLKIVTVDPAGISKARPERPADADTPVTTLADDASSLLGAITFGYSHAPAASTRAANSVTGLSKGNEVPVVAEMDAAPEVSGGAEIAIARGLAVHSFMEHVDLRAPLDGQVDRLVAAGKIPAENAGLIDLDDIRWFLNECEVGTRLKDAATIVREIPLLDSVDAPQLASADAYDRIMLRGRIDAVVQTDEGLWVVDYKTDRTFPEPGSAREQAYRMQMDLYRQTLQRSGLGKVLGVHLVFLSCRRILSV